MTPLFTVLDPRVKIVAVLILATLPLLFSDPFYLIGWLVFFIALWWWGKIDARPIMPLFYGGLIMVFVYVMYGTFLHYPEENTQACSNKIRNRTDYSY